MAFDTENDLEFTRKVTKNDWTMDLGEENPFNDVSEESKDFISSLLQSGIEIRPNFHTDDYASVGNFSGSATF